MPHKELGSFPNSVLYELVIRSFLVQDTLSSPITGILLKSKKRKRKTIQVSPSYPVHFKKLY